MSPVDKPFADVKERIEQAANGDELRQFQAIAALAAEEVFHTTNPSDAEYCYCILHCACTVVHKTKNLRISPICSPLEHKVYNRHHWAANNTSTGIHAAEEECIQQLPAVY